MPFKRSRAAFIVKDDGAEFFSTHIPGCVKNVLPKRVREFPDNRTVRLEELVSDFIRIDWDCPFFCEQIPRTVVFPQAIPPVIPTMMPRARCVVAVFIVSSVYHTLKFCQCLP